MKVISDASGLVLNKLMNFGKILINPSEHLLPNWIISRADPERGIVDHFIYRINKSSSNELLLDAGAGNFRFKNYLEAQGFTYESQDFDQVFDQDMRDKYTYVCDIENIPVSASRFDVIVCAQVLEHLANPWVALQEFSRILKIGGTLYLTTNFLISNTWSALRFF